MWRVWASGGGRIGALVIAQTGSVVLGLLGMLHIMLSFTLAYFVYGVMLGLHWFPFLNLLGCEFTPKFHDAQRASSTN